ncbi:MAG: cupredoxin domain-containing protein [Stenotrophobium sp.]
MRKLIASRIAAALLIVLCSGVLGYVWAAASAEKVKVIKVVAKRFEFIPSEITLKKGVPVEFEITTQDVVMGFSAPDLKQRADVLPQQVAWVRFTPDKTGTFPFLCDIFCGTGHENMNGTIKVVD